MRLELVNVIKEFCEMFKLEYLDGEIFLDKAVEEITL